MLVSPWMTALIGAVSYDLPFQGVKKNPIVFWAQYGIDLTESAQEISTLDTYRKVFERQIRYWDLRPMPDRQDAMPVMVLITFLLLAVTIPASKIIARIVEKKSGTFTVGGGLCLPVW